jgi:hypothetical protein
VNDLRPLIEGESVGIMPRGLKGSPVKTMSKNSKGEKVMVPMPLPAIPPTTSVRFGMKAVDFLSSQERLLSPSSVDAGLVPNPLRLDAKRVERIDAEKSRREAEKSGKPVPPAPADSESPATDTSTSTPFEFLGEPPDRFHKATLRQLPESSYFRALKRNWRLIFLVSRFLRDNNPYLGAKCETARRQQSRAVHITRDRCMGFNLWRGLNETYWHMEDVYRDRYGWNWMQ